MIKIPAITGEKRKKPFGAHDSRTALAPGPLGPI
jgi:hypothetical protein